MKKLLSLLLVLAMVLSFAACGTGDEGVNLTILIEEDDSMINTYSLLAVNPEAPFVDADKNPVQDVELNTAGADALINWMLSEEAADLIKDYGVAEYDDHLFYNLDGAPVSDVAIPAATEETKVIRMSTTTSVNDSGLLGYMIPIFEEGYGYDVEIFSAGTGKSIANAQCGNADLILVHSKSQEEAFVDAGFARKVEGFDAERLSFMYNYFVLCGPKEDPANVSEAESVLAAFETIAEDQHKFVSRGDASCTHTKELSLWPAELGITTEAESFADYTDWYISSNAGMGTCLMQAAEQGAYILSDKATFLTFVANYESYME
ncbi:MAG: substrate-binding domain-containing protein [Firmicutes bacterium]|nr:substrate-binding domain-containing protein [Bacillota bacterium]